MTCYRCSNLLILAHFLISTVAATATTTTSEVQYYYYYYYYYYHHQIITPWPESASELYRPIDLCLSAKLLPTFEDRRSHVVSATDPYGRILGFIDLLLPLLV
jgi:hypothetical protein